MASPERRNSGEARDGPASPLEAFKRLTRGLLAVNPDELKEAERRYQEEKEAPVVRRDPPVEPS